MGEQGFPPCCSGEDPQTRNAAKNQEGQLYVRLDGCGPVTGSCCCGVSSGVLQAPACVASCDNNGDHADLARWCWTLPLSPREERDHRLGRGVVRHSVRWCFRDPERWARDVAPHLHRNSCGRETNRFQLHAHAASYRSHSHFYFAEVLRVFQWPLAQILRGSETPRGTKQQIEGVPVHLSSLVHGRRNVPGVLLWSSSDVVLAVLLHCVVEHVSDRGLPRLRVGEGKPWLHWLGVSFRFRTPWTRTLLDVCILTSSFLQV